MKLSKVNQKTFVVRVVSHVLLPAIQDTMQRFALGAMVGVADSPAADRLVDTLTDKYYTMAKNIGLADDDGAIDVELAEAALHGAFEAVPTLRVEDLKLKPWAEKMLAGLAFSKDDIEPIMAIARQLAENTQNKGIAHDQSL